MGKASAIDAGFDVAGAVERLRRIIVEADGLPEDTEAFWAAVRHDHDSREKRLKPIARRTARGEGQVGGEKLIDVGSCKACGAAAAIMLMDFFSAQSKGFQPMRELAEAAAAALRAVRPATTAFASQYWQYAPTAKKIHAQALKHFRGEHDHPVLCAAPRRALKHLALATKTLEFVCETVTEAAPFDEIARAPGERQYKDLLPRVEHILHKHGFSDAEIAELVPDDVGDKARLNRIRVRRHRFLNRKEES